VLIIVVMVMVMVVMGIMVAMAAGAMELDAYDMGGVLVCPTYGYGGYLI
jgi:hypothetical protein